MARSPSQTYIPLRSTTRRGDVIPPGGSRREVNMFLSLIAAMQNRWFEFRSRMVDESGAVATEYVLLLVLIALAITGGMIFLATQLNAKFSDAGNGLNG